MRTFVGGCVVVLSAAAASAQTPAGRFTVTGSVGLQAAAPRLEDRFEFERFVETGSADVDYAADGGVVADVGFAFRIRGRFGAGVSASYFRRDGSARVEARIPHPFEFGRLRDISGDTSKLSRAETGIHAQLRYTRPLTRKLQLALAGGPSFFNVNQELVDEVNFTHEFPYDTATFVGTHNRRAKGSGVGFNASADVTWMLSRRVGLGALVRYTRGTADLDAAAGRTVSVDVGGVQAGGGLRLYF